MGGRHVSPGIAGEIAEEEVPGGAGLVDHEFVGRLERRFRRAGAEDLIVLLTNGSTPPAPPTGATLNKNLSVALALEYRGHWVKLTGNLTGMACKVDPGQDVNASSG